MNDACLPPGKGTLRNDMGMTGGPGNCYIPSSDPNLVGWWTFDYIIEDWALDSSGRAPHARLINGPNSVSGLSDKALDFDGIDDYVDMHIGGLISTLTNSTFTTWVNFKNDGGSWQRIFDFGSGTKNFMFLCPRKGTNGTMYFAIETSSLGTQSIDSSVYLSSGWHNVAVVFESGFITLYLDGVSLGQIESSLTPSSLGVTTKNWLGRSQYGWDAYLCAQIDDFRIYNRALSPDDLVAIMQGD
jgi:hypothetical protein